MEILVTVGYIAICVLLFSLAIAIHEFGHFIVALKLGFRVERFSIGFGPAIWKKTFRGVEYRLSWIPLGGYVSIPAVDPEGTKALEGGEQNTETTREKIPAWKEIAVAFAGPAMNLVLATILAIILACVPSARFGEGKPILDEISEVGAAARAGLQRGDHVLAIDGQPVATWYEMLTEVQLAGGREVVFKISRDGREMEIPVSPTKDDSVWRIGASAALALEIGAIEAGSVAEKAGLRPCDQILAMNDQPLAIWSDFSRALEANGTNACTLTILREAKEMKISLTPTMKFVYQMKGPFDYPAILGAVEPGSLAANAGLRAGDRVTKIGEQKIETWSELQRAIQETKGAETKFAISRGSEMLEISLAPRKGADGRYYIHARYADDSRVVLAKNRDEFFANDEILAIEDTRVANWRELEAAVHRLSESRKNLRAQVRRDGKEIAILFTPKADCLGRGVSIGVQPYACAAWMTKRNPLQQMGDDMQGIFRILKALVTPKQAKATSQALGGPVMIAMGIYTSVRQDFWSGLGFLRYLNVNLAILNLLPIPVLDGGLILFAFIALVFRRRIPEKIISKLSMGFMYALLGAMLILIYRDSVRGVKAHRQHAETIEYKVTDHELENTDTPLSNR